MNVLNMEKSIKVRLLSWCLNIGIGIIIAVIGIFGIMCMSGCTAQLGFGNSSDFSEGYRDASRNTNKAIIDSYKKGIDDAYKEYQEYLDAIIHELNGEETEEEEKWSL